jgi:3-phosphoshikimate 1-carboxyvinyltransferase
MRLASRPSGPLRGRVAAPGDKSISHRALILGALAEGETAITGLLEGADVLRTAAAMRAFGAGVSQTGPGAWTVRGRGAAGFAEPDGVVDFGNSGTGVRLTMGAAAGFNIAATYVGDASLSGRPMARVLDPLAKMGARWLARSGGRLPATVAGPGRLSALSHTSNIGSAQVKSAILLAGLNADGWTQVTERAPSRDHTENMLEAFGADISVTDTLEGRIAAVKGGSRLMGVGVAVPGDPSSAAFPLVAAAIVPGSDVTVTGVLLNPLRIGLIETLREMGADLVIANERTAGGEMVGDIRVRGSALTGVTVPAARAPAMIDEYPALAVAAAFASGETRMEGIGEMRVKESDRIALTLAGLRACGVDAEDGPDWLAVRGGPVAGGAEVATHGDHRIAMSFLVLGLAARAGVVVDEADMIATSFPGFAALMNGLGADVAHA